MYAHNFAMQLFPADWHAILTFRRHLERCEKLGCYKLLLKRNKTAFLLSVESKVRHFQNTVFESRRLVEKKV